ncbi:MAG: H(+)/Cl(-) exchange transporter ClcA [Phycisphaerae bacterium]
MNASSTGAGNPPIHAPRAGGDPHAHAPRHLHFGRAALIGLCAGLLAVAFRRALSAAESGRGSLLTTLHEHPAWGWLVLPAIGLVVGSLVGYVTQRFAPDAAGSGIPHLKGVLLHVRTLSWTRLLPVKFLGGVAGIGAGLSLGREGPTVQMGAAVARALAGPLRAPPSDIPQLLSAGAGAGLAAAFNAPLAGLIFVVEELHRELSTRTAAGALVAAVCATVITQWFAGDTPSFEVRGLMSMPLAALPLAATVGVLGGAVGVLFNTALLGAQALAIRQRRVPRWLLVGLAGVLVGLVAWRLPDAVGGGQGVAERILGGTMGVTLGALAVLVVAKFALSVLSYASGAPGGIFAPMLLLGALLGAAFSKAAELALPPIAAQGQVLAVLGMAAMFVGSVRAPLTGIVLISEMTNGYELLFPICITALAANLAAEALRGVPVYDALLKADLNRTGHGPTGGPPRTVYIGVQSSCAIAGKKIMHAGLPAGCLIIALERHGRNLLPTANTVLEPGDHISVLVPGESPHATMVIVRLCTGL